MSRITLVEYDPCWPLLFEERASEIATLLSPFVREVHHIGSTAVSGLAAKPNRYRCGHRGSEKATGADCAPIRTQAASGPSPPIRAPTARLLFRDQLRERPDYAERYETLKKRLATDANCDWDNTPTASATLSTKSWQLLQ